MAITPLTEDMVMIAPPRPCRMGGGTQEGTQACCGAAAHCDRAALTLGCFVAVLLLQLQYTEVEPVLTLRESESASQPVG